MRDLGLIFIVAACGLCVASVVFSMRRSAPLVARRKSRAVRPERYETFNGLADLLQRVGRLKEGGATWPAVMANLNADNSPQIRTLLLELRQAFLNEPMRAIRLVEEVCLYSPKPNDAIDIDKALDVAVQVARKHVPDHLIAEEISRAWVKALG